MSKFASSAAHVLGKPLVSCESCTWQSEHFTETLAQSKHIIDRLFVAGINHVFYHGTAYSPADAGWPGWLFYASTHFEPNNPTWRDFPTLNAYITRCQSLLQAGQPDNDVLLYWPLHDLWQKHPKLFGLTIEGKWLESEPFGATAQTLWDGGIAFDYVSDHQLHKAKVADNGLDLPGGHYKTILVPPCRFLPLDTLKTLLALANKGVTILFQDQLPLDVPGQGDLANRREAFHSLLNAIKWQEMEPPVQQVQQAHWGKGRLLVGKEPIRLLALAKTGVRRESLTDHAGLLFVRRKFTDGHHYFLVNQSAQPLDVWIPLGVPARSVALMDPMTGEIGMAAMRHNSGETEVHLQLESGESILLRALAKPLPAGPAWDYTKSTGDAIVLQGTWKVEAVGGGPVLPEPFVTQLLNSWTEQDDKEWQRFAGTARYTLTFDAPLLPSASNPASLSSDPSGKPAPMWLLDLGDARESAHVRLNGQAIGTVIAPPFRFRLDPHKIVWKPTGNVLEVEVTNVAANRIRDLDRRKVAWRIFHDINFVSIDYKSFDASNWPLRPSGLIGPVRLFPGH